LAYFLDDALRSWRVSQIEAEFKRFSKYLEPEVRIANYVGGIARKLNEDELKENSTRPHIVIGTPGRLADLAESGKLPLGDIKFFIVDECDKVLDQLGAPSRWNRCAACPGRAPLASFSDCSSSSARRRPVGALHSCTS
jgi:DEAD/DEAH box helicase